MNERECVRVQGTNSRLIEAMFFPLFSSLSSNPLIAYAFPPKRAISAFAFAFSPRRFDYNSARDLLGVGLTQLSAAVSERLF